MKKTKRSKPEPMSCGNCCGGLTVEHNESGITLVCDPCGVRVAGPFDDRRDIPLYKAA